MAADRLKQGLSIKADIMTEINALDLRKLGTDTEFTLGLLYYFRLLTRGSEEGTLQFASDCTRNEVRFCGNFVRMLGSVKVMDANNRDDVTRP
jgi:hypothetical protein